MLSPGTELFLAYVWYKGFQARWKKDEAVQTYAEFIETGIVFARNPDEYTVWRAHGIPETRILTTYEKGVGND